MTHLYLPRRHAGLASVQGFLRVNYLPWKGKTIATKKYLKPDVLCAAQVVMTPSIITAVILFSYCKCNQLLIMALFIQGIKMDAAAEIGRNPVSTADAGRDVRTRFARPNSQARTGTGKCLLSLFRWPSNFGKSYPVDLDTLPCK